MANSYFEFKQFRINQQNCSMKVGTDGVLLGAWCEIGTMPCRVLDIGAGSGLISLMIAQRNEQSRVTAVEIDSSAAQQCSENFEQSTFGHQLTVVCGDIQSFAEAHQNSFDYIVSNPPFFNNSLKNPDPSKSLARHTESLSYRDLCLSVSLMLSDKGVFSVILPYEESKIFRSVANEFSLGVVKQLNIKGVDHKPIRRVMMQLAFGEFDCDPSPILVIEQGGRHNYSEDYIKLTEKFYLNLKK